jgi:hypothetical protein
MIGMKNPEHEQCELLDIQHMRMVGIKNPEQEQCEILDMNHGSVKSSM